MIDASGGEGNDAARVLLGAFFGARERDIPRGLPAVSVVGL